MVCEILFSNLYLDLIEFEINYNYNYNLILPFEMMDLRCILRTKEEAISSFLMQISAK
jgi:hypothetical protein